MFHHLSGYQHYQMALNGARNQTQLIGAASKSPLFLADLRGPMCPYHPQVLASCLRLRRNRRDRSHNVPQTVLHRHMHCQSHLAILCHLG